MYDSKSASINEIQNSLTETVTSTIYNLLNGQDSAIHAIENKLHLILDRNTPSKDIPTQPSPDPRDFSERIKYELSKLETHNVRLERILKHLSEII